MKGIMILKYTIAAASSSPSITHLQQIISQTFPNILKCIQDTDDDVRQVASSSLEPISTRLNLILADSPSHIQLLVRTLIDVLSDLDDLGTSCSSVMSLLSDLLAVESNQLVFIRLLNGQSILPRLLPFLSHSSVSVRQTTMSTIEKIVRAINSSSPNQFRFEELEKQADLSTLMRLLYQQAILMNSEAGFKQLERCLTDLWRTLCHQLSSKCLIAACFPFITTWLALMMYPSNQVIEAAYLVVSNESSSSAKEYLGSNQIRFEDKLYRDAIQIKCRFLAAHLLSILFDRVSQIADLPEKPFEQILAYLCTQVNFKSGLQRFCLSLMCVGMCQVAETTGCKLMVESLQKNLAPKLIACLDDENTIYFDEIAVMFTRLQKDVRFLITNYHRLLTTNLS